MATAWNYIMLAVGCWIAGVTIALGSFSILIGIHDYGNTEDSRVIWSCAYMGNHQCGPDQPRVQVDLSKLREW